LLLADARFVSAVASLSPKIKPVPTGVKVISADSAPFSVDFFPMSEFGVLMEFAIVSAFKKRAYSPDCLGTFSDVVVVVLYNDIRPKICHRRRRRLTLVFSPKSLSFLSKAFSHHCSL